MAFEIKPKQAERLVRDKIKESRCVKMTKTEKQQQKANAIESLKNILKAGDTVYTIIRHVSASGMSRSISLVIAKDNEMQDITWYAARAMEDTIDSKNGGIKVSGCGMDIGFSVVYNLSRVLFKDEDRTDAGYKLNQQWL